ncbi:hypothetical protein [Leisingera thetidis]|uniref:hypothetical protein n=1 Tax=Leisingera thetidis TaxID=2930199 RepID=UPI0021F7C3BE|nr:hypothetical protein [Leisingera thetidis]
MGLKKAAGILVFSVQAVIGADYYFQTRDAGLNWGDLSATDYGTIVQDRFARARAARADGGSAGLPETAAGGGTVWSEAASYGRRLLTGGEQVAEAQSGEEAPQPVCIRRGNVADC